MTPQVILYERKGGKKAEKKEYDLEDPELSSEWREHWLMMCATLERGLLVLDAWSVLYYQSHSAVSCLVLQT